MLVNEHPLRRALHNEVHARPPEPMTAPLVISHVVTLPSGRQRGADFQTLRKTCWAISSASAVPIMRATVPITRF
jgi:hypothetical protein